MTKREISPDCNKCGRRLKMYVDNEDTGTYGYFCEYCEIIKKTRQDILKEVDSKELLERLADLEHQQWSHLINYLLSLGRDLDTKVHNNYWWLANTPYSKLSRRDKEEDKIWARRVIKELKKKFKEKT